MIFVLMYLDIKDKGGNIRCTVPINEGAKGYSELMSKDYIKLPFSLATPITFAIGDYVDLRGVFDEALGGKLSKIYKFISLQTPTYDTETGTFKYELQLDAYYYEWNLKLFKYLPEKHSQEASWSLTAPLDVHMGVFLRNLKARGFKYSGVDYTFEIDSTVTTEALALTYSDVKLVDALTQMAEEADCEWWVTDNVIHFGQCEHGSGVKMELNAEASDMTRSDSKGTYATRIYAFGAERNIPTNYRPVDEQTVVSGVVQKRLMLPADTPYVDAYEDMAESDVIEGVVTFDDVYPRRVGTMESITTVDRKLETDEEETTFKAYQFRDSGIQFASKYILDGKDLSLVFQSGKLNGMTFGVTFNPDDKNPEEQLFEIVANEDYGRLLPDDTLRPEVGDKYVLFNFDIQLVSDTYIPAAEKELLQKAKEYVAKTCIDDGTYTVTLDSNWVYNDMLDRTYDIGQKVSLVNPGFFAGTRDSRVLGWEMCLDFPYDAPVYTIGESAQYSRLDNVESEVDALTYKGQTYTGGSGSGVYVVRQHDLTPASDSNVFSAIRSLSTFLRKDKADSTNNLVSFLGGLLSNDIQSDGFAEGILGGGFGAWMDEKGQSHIEVDNLLVRLKAEFASLVIREIKHIGGEFILSAASVKCTKVEKIAAEPLYYSDGSAVTFSDGTEAETPDVYRCWFTVDDGEKAVTNDFSVGDLATCRTWNIKDGSYEHVTNRYYWRMVVGVGEDYIDLSTVDCDTYDMQPYETADGLTYETSDGEILMVATDGNPGLPMAGDEIVQLGNRYDEDRQSAIVLSTYGDDSPSLKLYRGINDYTLDGKEFFCTSRKQISAKVDSISLKGKNGAYLSVGEELDSRPTAESLLQTGINVSTGEITVTADKFTVRTAKGLETAVFTVKDGKPVLRAGMIDVDSLFAGTVNANSATITNFTFANAQSKDGSFTVDGNGVTKIGGFTITNSSIGSSLLGEKLVLSRNGILFDSTNKTAGIGDVLPPSSASTELTAAVFTTNLLHGNFCKPIDGDGASASGEGAVVIRATGGTYKTSYDSKQIALSIVTDNTTYDTAIDFRGRLRTNGTFGLTGTFGVRDGNDNYMTVEFVNGIYVGTRH